MPEYIVYPENGIRVVAATPGEAILIAKSQFIIMLNGEDPNNEMIFSVEEEVI